VSGKNIHQPDVDLAIFIRLNDEVQEFKIDKGDKEMKYLMLI